MTVQRFNLREAFCLVSVCTVALMLAMVPSSGFASGTATTSSSSSGHGGGGNPLCTGPGSSDPGCQYFCHSCTDSAVGATAIASILEGENAIIEAAEALGHSHAGGAASALTCIHGLTAGVATTGPHCAHEGPECFQSAQTWAHIACAASSCLGVLGAEVPHAAAISLACAAGNALAMAIQCYAEKAACENAHRNAQPIELEPCSNTHISVQACAAGGGPRPLIDIQNDCVRVVTGNRSIPPLQQGTCSASCVTNTQASSTNCRPPSPTPRPSATPTIRPTSSATPYNTPRPTATPYSSPRPTTTPYNTQRPTGPSPTYSTPGSGR